jgi:hypothetical protein
LETSPTLGDNSWLPVRAQAISIKPLDSLTDRLEVTIQTPNEVCFFRLRATVLQ